MRPVLQGPLPPPRPTLVVDNGSSYTDDLIEVLDGLAVQYRRVMPADLNMATLPGYGAFVLSGRKRNSRLMNAVNSGVVRHAVSAGTKLLGICYGAEIMALALGGTIRRSSVQQKNVRVTVQVTGQIPVAPRGPMDVFESHAYEVSCLPPQMASVAASEGCRCEIIRHATRDMYGTQFHPEMSRDGRALIGRFCRL